MSLPESYSDLVTTLEGRDETNLIIECVIGKILDEYHRRTESGIKRYPREELNEKDSEIILKSSIAVTNTSSKNQSTRYNKRKENQQER